MRRTREEGAKEGLKKCSGAREKKINKEKRKPFKL